MRRNARAKAAGKEWYKKMLAAKQAKADKAKREMMGPLDLTNKVNPELPDTPKRIEASSQVTSNKMEENTSSVSALNKALDRLREQARGL